MKSLKHRVRSKKGVTDYYHRMKMVSSYSDFLRIRFGRKNNYFFTGLYQTKNPGAPDLCYTYLESRWLRKQDQVLLHNVETSYIFGAFYAKKLNSMVIDKPMILDLGRQKKISYRLFLYGLLNNLDSDKASLLRHGIAMDRLSQYQDKYNLEQYSFK